MQIGEVGGKSLHYRCYILAFLRKEQLFNMEQEIDDSG